MSIKDGPGEGTWSVFAQKVVEERDAARDFARRTLRSLSEVTAEETDPRSDAAAMACVLLAARELDMPGTAPDARDWSDVRLRAWIDQLRDTLQSPGEGVTPATGAAAAMVCAALGPAAGESMTQRAWDPGQPERALQSTPWLVDRLPADAAAACQALAGLTLPPGRFSLPTGGAVVNSAVLVRAQDAGNRSGEHCRVLGRISPVDPAAPSIGFQVNLPSAWTGKPM